MADSVTNLWNSWSSDKQRTWTRHQEFDSEMITQFEKTRRIVEETVERAVEDAWERCPPDCTSTEDLAGVVRGAMHDYDREHKKWWYERSPHSIYILSFTPALPAEYIVLDIEVAPKGYQEPLAGC